MIDMKITMTITRWDVAWFVIIAGSVIGSVLAMAWFLVSDPIAFNAFATVVAFIAIPVAVSLLLRFTAVSLSS